MNIVTTPPLFSSPSSALESSTAGREALLSRVSSHLAAATAVLLVAALLVTVPAAAQPASPERSAPADSAPSVQKTLSTTGANLVTRAGLDLNGASGTAIGDVNGDDRPDLLLAGNSSTLYLQQADGSFAPADAGLISASSGSANIADVDGKNGPDLLITGIGDGFSAETVLYLQQADGSFDPASTSLDGVRYSSTAIADVDGQNGPDLLVVGENDSGDPTSTLYLQQSDGTFDPAGVGLTGVAEGSASIANVDGQNGPDLLITGTDPNGNETATLYLQQADGSFDPAGVGLTGVSSGATAIANVDGQNGPDLLIAGGEFSQSATLYLQQSDGTFDPADAGLTGVSDASVSIGDVDGQNGPDLLITGEGPELEGTATLYLQQADGSFDPADAGLTGVSNVGPDMTAIGDVDGDSDADLLIAASSGTLFGSNRTRLYVNRTTQTDPNRAPRLAQKPFARRQATGTPFRARFEFGDPDGDRLSLQLTQGGNHGNVRFTDAGNGTAELEITPSKGLAGQTLSFTVEAADGNGKTSTASFDLTLPDVVAGLRLPGLEQATSTLAEIDGQNGPDLLVIGGKNVTLYLQQSDGSFTGVSTSISPVAQGDISVGDVNQDGAPDLLVVGENDRGTPSTTLYLQQSDGTFDPAQASLADVEDGATAIADVDGQNGPDLLITGATSSQDATTTLYLQQSDGTFDPANASLDGVNLGSVSIADVDGQNGPDLLVTGDNASSTPTATLYLQQSNGSFDPASLTGVGLGSASAIADVDGVNGPDLLLVGQDSDFRSAATLYLQQADGSFAPAQAGLLGGGRRSSCAIADVDGDSDGDLILTSSFGSTVYLQQDDGSFSAAQAGLLGVSRSTASVADVDGDGDPDFLVTGDRDPIANADANLASSTTLYENLLNPAEAVATQDVSAGQSSQTFDGTGTTIDFSSSTSGDGPVRAVKYNVGPSTRPGLPSDQNVSKYRFVIEAAPSLDVGADTELRFDVSTLGGTPTPGEIDVYRRNPPGDGFYDDSPGASSFTKINDSNVRYDSGDDELVATVDGFSEFVFVSDSNPLPVELARFTARLNEAAVRLQWATASETNNAAFDIQRRAAGADDWTEIGRVEGGGTTAEGRSYRFTDSDLPYEADSLHYRLQQIDTDGTTALSKTVTVRRGVASVQLQAPVPNPSSQRATLHYALPQAQTVTLRLYDVMGRQVRTITRTAAEGRHEQAFDVSRLPSGVYFLRLHAGSETATTKLTVVK